MKENKPEDFEMEVSMILWKIINRMKAPEYKFYQKDPIGGLAMAVIEHVEDLKKAEAKKITKYPVPITPNEPQGTATIEGEPAKISKWSDTDIEFIRKEKEKTVTVCGSCFMACCWQGIVMCADSFLTNTVEKTVAELESMDLEHSDYWRAAK